MGGRRGCEGGERGDGGWSEIRRGDGIWHIDLITIKLVNTFGTRHSAGTDLEPSEVCSTDLDDPPAVNNVRAIHIHGWW